MKKQSQSGASAAWAIAVAGLTAVIVLELTDSLPFMSLAGAAVVNEREAKPGSMDIPAVRQRSDNLADIIAERPLFSLSRRPMAPELRVTERPTRRQAPALMATLMNGEMRVALLHHPSEGALRRREGQDVGGWRLDEISEGRVRMRQGERVEWVSVQKNPLTLKRAQKSPPE